MIELLTSKYAFAFLAFAFVLIGYIPYVVSTLRGITRPHILTWSLWGLLNGIGCAAQLSAGGGLGSVATGGSFAFCVIIAVLAYRQNLVRITQGDWILFGAGLLAVPLWFMIESPILAVIWISIIDFVAFLPTIRKSYHHPVQEKVFAFSVSTLKFIVSLFALESYSLVTYLYPASLVVTNSSFIAMVLWRRRVLARSQ
ncbi:MAG: hypothetical protein VX730_00480 [Pseudomonadota bacterium]|nr:hypothetical protein [Pseudomonadota bacterium]